MSELSDREWLEGLAAMVINAPTRDRLLRIAATLGERELGRTPEPSEGHHCPGVCDLPSPCMIHPPGPRTTEEE